MPVKQIRLLLFVLLWPAWVHAEITQVSNEDLQQLQQSGVTIIDVRRQDEWMQTGMVEGSHGITFFDKQGRYDVNAWLAEVSELIKPDDPVVLICARGVRTAKIAELLDKRLGYTGVHNVTDGIRSWIKNDQPVVVARRYIRITTGDEN